MLMKKQGVSEKSREWRWPQHEAKPLKIKWLKNDLETSGKNSSLTLNVIEKTAS